MNKRQPVLILQSCVVVLVLIGCSIGIVDRSPVDMKPESLQIGALWIQDKRTVVVRNADELDALSKIGLINAGDNMPKIDFSKYMLLGVFLGIYPVIERPQLSILSIKKHFDPDRIEVTFKVKDWNPAWRGGFTIPSANSIHSLMLIPRSDLPVKFIEVKSE